MKEALKEFSVEIPGLSEEEKPLYHYNCAEKMLLAANKKYDLKLNQQTINAIIPFGGGMGCRRTCGIVLGALAVAGVLWGGPKPFDHTKIRTFCAEYVQWFLTAFGSLDCPYILLIHADPDPAIKCELCIEKSAEKLEELIEKYNAL